MHASRLVVVAAGLLLTSGLVCGCHSSAPPPGGGPATGSASAPAPGMPDLTKPYPAARQSEELEPLGIAQSVARATGGTWVALAPKPLALIPWKPNRSGSASTVESFLKQLQASKTPVRWELRDGYALLFFGTEAELKELGAQPMEEVRGFYAASDSGEGLVRAVAEVLRVKIRATAELYRARDAQLAARKRLDEETKPTDPQMLAYQMAGYGEEAGAARPHLHEYRVADRMDAEELIEGLAEYFAGEARLTRPGEWELTPISEPHRIAQEIGKREEVIKQDAGTTPDVFSSFAARSSGESGGAEEVAQLPEVGETTREALDGLALLGAQAVPTLSSYLDSERPVLAHAALQVLTEMPAPEAQQAVLDFAKRLEGPAPTKGARFVGALRTALIDACSRSRNPATEAWLAESARNPRLSRESRQTARMALLTHVRAEALTAAFPRAELERRELASGEAELFIRSAETKGSSSSPGGPGKNEAAPRDAVKPLATFLAPTGESWAVVLSSRYGGTDDVWLARGVKGQWTEFLFTGQRFPRRQEYSGTAPGPGSCTLAVKEDRVTVNPPNQKLAQEAAKLRTLYESGNYSSPEAQKKVMRWQQLETQLQGQLSKPLTFSLAALRQDGDRDGVTDLVEMRLGTDPKKADTDGDGLPDGKDANPLAAPAPVSDRSRLLQSLFALLYGGEPEPRPLVVVLGPQKDQAPKQRQEFLGARGRVLCLTNEEYLRRASDLKDLPTLQFGGPTDPESTILAQEGPCLFNDGRSKAEIHFWQTGAGNSSGNDSMSRYAAMMGQQGGVEYVARFTGGGGWKLTSLEPWRWRTMQQAATEAATRQQMPGSSVF